ncbi:Ubiquitin--protein ligase [Bertholletia excelsa]
MMDLFSDIDSFSESSSSEEQNDIEMLYGGQACRLLSNLEKTIDKIDEYLSFERAFTYGDFVCSANDPSGQMGRVVNVDMIVDLESGHGKIIKDVNSGILQRIHSISVGDYVVLGPWVGKADKIVHHVTVVFDDGAKSQYTTMGPEKLLPLSSDLLEGSQYLYYPGQKVQIQLSTVSKSAKWLCGSWKEKRDQGTVSAVEVGLVYVDWLACARVGCERMPAPPCLQEPKNLTLLSCFSHVNWQLGDWCMLPNSHSEGITHKVFLDDPTKTSLVFPEIFVIVKTKTKVDVVWQDGSQSLGLDSNLLLPANIIDAYDFWPEQYVLEKSTCDDLHVSSGQRWGVVKSVNAKERTVRVKWESFAVNQAIGIEEEQMEETVSAYELAEHPDYSYCPGDIVLQLEKQLSVDKENIQSSHMSTKFDSSKDAEPKDKRCDGEQNVFLNSRYLCCIGIVVGFKGGNVEVKWASGHKTEVAPYEILRIDKCQASPLTPLIHGEDVEQLTQEMIEHDKESLDPPRGKNLFNYAGHYLPRAAIGMFISIMGSLFSSLSSTPSSSMSDRTSEEGCGLMSDREEEVLELFNLCTKEPAMEVSELKYGQTNLNQQVKDVHDDKAHTSSSDRKYPEVFKQFDVVTGCLDHHFVDYTGKGLKLSQVKKSWLTNVQQEWSILKKDLPETIYARVYEERMDLLRAAIIGAPGTPYHDGLFFFDIFLPPGYPYEPPLVHYNSGGLRLNPNLYESGKVCLSLLNTWTGTGTEVWNPGSSTILQVLLSLQALVLNEKPYFNEAGYDKQMGRTEGEKNSVSYNENAFLLSCKSMLYILRKPPEHFEAFVEEHFSRRSKNILLACEGYMEGAPVGCTFGNGKSEEENQQGSSTGFKIMLSKLFPKLVEAFSDKGIDCSQYIDP